MKHLVISLAVFVCVFSCAMLGFYLRERLPQHHLNEESSSSIKLATGLIATISALVLGLLISSAKNSFDTVSGDLVRNAVNIVRLDRALAEYGSETGALRAQLKSNYATWIDMIGSGDSRELDRLNGPDVVGQIEHFQRSLAQLAPDTAAKQRLQTRSMEISDEVFAARWLALLQKRGSIPMTLLVVLVSWLAIIFGTFGLFSPRNGTVIFFFLLCAFSASGAIFVILEMDTPLDGMITVSTAPMREALARLGS